MDNNAPLSVTMGDREKWLCKWIKNRGYIFDSNNHRNTFIYIYYFTVKAAYGETWASNLTRKRNSCFANPISDSELDKKMKYWNSPTHSAVKYTNETIISTLGITDTEVEKLKIGHNKKVKEERKIRRIQKRERNEDILLLRGKGLTQKEIASELNVSLSTVKRVLREAKNILKGSHFTITDTLKDENVLTRFVSPTAKSLYPLYKTESDNAPSNEYEVALAKLQTSNDNIFIQGSAGTGKSTLINEYLNSLSKEERKSVLLVAPTGKAAELINGVTIHKAFELPNCVQVPDDVDVIPKMLNGIKTIICDEISMVRFDVFTKMMQILELVAKTTGQDIRLIVLGDLGQLQPVVTKANKEILKRFYPSIQNYYMFVSPKWKAANFEIIILHKVKRQNDEEFIEHLNGIKYGRLSDIDWIMSNASPLLPKNAIYICTTRKRVDEFNNQAIESFSPSELKTFRAEINGKLTEDLPCPAVLTVAKGARVMTVCNSNKYKNGSIGTVKSITDTTITVKFDNGKTATIKRKNFELENGTTYKQFPLMLAYAITVHRSQGSTFENVAIVCDDFFEAGMLYVALSRCNSLDNLTFLGRLKASDLKVDTEALKITVSTK